MLSEIGRERQILYDLTSVWNLKNKTKLRKRGQICGYQRRGVGGGKLDEGGRGRNSL